MGNKVLTLFGGNESHSSQVSMRVLHSPSVQCLSWQDGSHLSESPQRKRGSSEDGIGSLIIPVPFSTTDILCFCDLTQRGSGVRPVA